MQTILRSVHPASIFVVDQRHVEADKFILNLIRKSRKLRYANINVLI